jgi:hypothetical protein
MDRAISLSVSLSILLSLSLSISPHKVKECVVHKNCESSCGSTSNCVGNVCITDRLD